MESFNHTTQFTYNSGQTTLNDIDDPEQDDEPVFSGLLEIFVHNARNIHNICIYEEQDVYAKFSLTYNPDETVTTKIVQGGGKNPDFNEELVLNVTQLDAVLKCEVWMFSKIRHLLEDQLLGFTLVPISMVASNAKYIEEEFSLSSTDLFHSPAGTVKLRLKLTLHDSMPFGISSSSTGPGISSISSEVVLLDCKGLERGQVEVLPDRDEYSRIEFPDINVVRENHQMISEYFPHAATTRCGGITSVLHSGILSYSSSTPSMNTAVGSVDKVKISSVTDGRLLVAAVPAAAQDIINDNDHHSTTASVNSTPSSSKGAEIKDEDEHQIEEEHNSSRVKNDKKPMSLRSSADYQVFATAPLVNMNFEAEHSAAMQQQIVDMYTKSMQQFTESLEKMRIPIDLDHKKEADLEQMSTDLVLDQESRHSNDKLLGTDQTNNKKDGSRVFYGSRAFF